MTKYINDSSNFGADGPFFRIIREGLKGLAKGDDYFDLLADDVIFEYVISVPGYPKRVQGRQSIIDLYNGYDDYMRVHSADSLRIYRDPEASIVVLEYEVHGESVQTGRSYNNRFVSSSPSQTRKWCTGETTSTRSPSSRRQGGPTARLEPSRPRPFHYACSVAARAARQIPHHFCLHEPRALYAGVRAGILAAALGLRPAGAAVRGLRSAAATKGSLLGTRGTPVFGRDGAAPALSALSPERASVRSPAVNDRSRALAVLRGGADDRDDPWDVLLSAQAEGCLAVARVRTLQR
jgi:uncharacterized protein